MGTKLVIVGGRTNDPEEKISSIEIYDTETAEWERVGPFSRYRHALAVQGDKLFIHGGFEPEYISQPLETMTILDMSNFNMKHGNELSSTKITPMIPQNLLNGR